jgi:hypothetical protein
MLSKNFRKADVSAQKVWVNSRLYEHSTSGELFFKAFYPDFLSGYRQII